MKPLKPYIYPWLRIIKKNVYLKCNINKISKNIKENKTIDCEQTEKQRGNRQNWVAHRQIHNWPNK